MPAVRASRSRADLAVLDRDGVLEIATTSSRARTKTVSSEFIAVPVGTQRPAGPAEGDHSRSVPPTRPVQQKCPVRLFASDAAGPAAAIILGAILHAAAAGLRGRDTDHREGGESCGEKEDFRLRRENFHRFEHLERLSESVLRYATISFYARI